MIDSQGTRPRGSGTGHRGVTRLFSGLNILVGLWLIAAPLVLNFDYAGQLWNSVVVGAAVVVFALVHFFLTRAVWPGVVTAVLGIWLAVMPWFYDYGVGLALVHNVIAGIAIAALSAAAILSSQGTGVGTRPERFR